MTDTYSPVPELNLLKELQDRIGGENISTGFDLAEFGATTGIDTWSKDPEFLDSFRSFAYANASGSKYALWRIDDRADLADLPVVVFGDEGGIGLVARNLRELFQQLACDKALYVGDYDAGFDDEDDDDSDDEAELSEYDRHAEYLDWLARHFGLAPAADPNDLVVAAEKEFAVRFANWVGRFVADESFVKDFVREINRLHSELTDLHED
ncbi:hypothetical protein [Goodfellowiella coeruleoviolacea]|uniref:Uncharacterized protein n=1 Tax=Goodfellowiella coeruleoviolacea TaxID=334858 RepID=A0AAE3KIY0_9PSEU|nr:hypothetical protein [Goodfellowiella coeruleoviolacea]MCP2169716.1 hypothetical protein [Goodfellowiella coeruleoviolacea]